MAELNKPEYQTKRMPGSRRAVYNVQPARSQAPGPDETAGDVTLSTANIFSKIQDSLGVFAEIYAQSENTANVLQAKGLLIDKMKDTQRIHQLITTELPKTGYEHLKLKDVLDKYQSIDGQGKTDLNIGEGLSHNISPLRMPDDLSDQVKNMLEEQWVRMDIGIMNGLISQVTDVQSKQTLSLYDEYVDDFKSRMLGLYLSSDSIEEVEKEAQDLQDDMDAQADELGDLGTWGLSEIRDKKLQNGQIRLNSAFLSEYLDNENPETSRENSLRKARQGLYKYEDKNGIKITLNSNHWQPYTVNEKERIRDLTVSEQKTQEINSESLLLEKEMRNMWKDSHGNLKSLDGRAFSEKVSELVMSGKFEHIPPQQLFRAIFNQERANILEQDRIKAEKDRKIETLKDQLAREEVAEAKEKELNKLTNKLAEIGMMFDDSRTTQAAIKYYGKKDINGRWVGKESEKLKKLLGNKYAESHHITTLIRIANRRERHEFKVEESEIIEAYRTKKLRELSSKAGSDILGSSYVLHTFGKEIELSNGKKRWELDYSKLGSYDTIGGKILLGSGIGDRGGTRTNRTNRQIQTVQASAILPIFDRARSQFKEFMRIEEKSGEGWTQAEILNWEDRITGAYINNIQTRILYGEGLDENDPQSVRRRTFDEAIGSYPNGKVPSENLQIYFNALRDTLERVAKLGEDHDKFTFPQLEVISKELISATDHKGNVVHGKFKGHHLKLVQQVMPIINKRKKDLIDNIVETGFIEGEVIKEDGTYDLQKYWEWQKRFGIYEENYKRVVPQKILHETSEVAKMPSPQKSTEYLNNLLGLLDKYGPVGSDPRRFAYIQLEEKIPYTWRRMARDIFYGKLVKTSKVEEKWKLANN